MNTIKCIAAAVGTAAILTTGALSLAGPAGAAARPASKFPIAPTALASPTGYNRAAEFGGHVRAGHGWGSIGTSSTVRMPRGHGWSP